MVVTALITDVLTDTHHDFDTNNIEEEFDSIEHGLEFTNRIKIWANEGQIKHIPLNNC